MILTFLYWSKLYQIGWHTTYMNTYNESAGECSQKYLLRKLWLTFFKQICNAVNFAVVLLILIKKWDSLWYISRIVTRNGGGNFIDQLFFQEHLFSRTHLRSYDYKNSKSNGQCDCHKLSEFDTCNYLYLFSCVFRP